MAAKKKMEKLETVVSPVGKAATCFVTKPSTEYNDDGEYVVKLLLEKTAENKKFLGKLNALNKAALDKMKSIHADLKTAKPVEKANIPFGATPDGENYYVNVRQAAKIKVNGEIRNIKIPIRDAKRQLIKAEDLDISKGSILKLAIDVLAYATSKKEVGVSLKLKEVMCIKAKAFEYSSAFDEGDEVDVDNFELDEDDIDDVEEDFEEEDEDFEDSEGDEDDEEDEDFE